MLWVDALPRGPVAAPWPPLVQPPPLRLRSSGRAGLLWQDSPPRSARSRGRRPAAPLPCRPVTAIGRRTWPLPPPSSRRATSSTWTPPPGRSRSRPPLPLSPSLPTLSLLPVFASVCPTATWSHPRSHPRSRPRFRPRFYPRSRPRYPPRSPLAPALAPALARTIFESSAAEAAARKVQEHNSIEPGLPSKLMNSPLSPECLCSTSSASCGRRACKLNKWCCSCSLGASGASSGGRRRHSDDCHREMWQADPTFPDPEVGQVVYCVGGKQKRYAGQKPNAQYASQGALWLCHGCGVDLQSPCQCGCNRGVQGATFDR